MFLVDDSGSAHDVNDAACRLLGVERDELIGTRYLEFLASGSRETGPERLRIFLDTGVLAGVVTLVSRAGGEVSCKFSAAANVTPGRHLLILVACESVKPPPQADEAERRQRSPSETVALTDRERQTLALLASGESTAGIGELLGLRPETVRNHVRTARLRLGARSRSEAVALAVESGQIELGGSKGRAIGDDLGLDD